MVHFISWLREFNQKQRTHIGFYGLDLYSLQASREHVIEYLSKIDPKAAERVNKAYQCFDESGFPHQKYGLAVDTGVQRSCEGEVIRALMELNRKQHEFMSKDASVDAQDRAFFASLNALVVKDAEEYYRNMYRGTYPLTWNLRDQVRYQH